MFQGLLFSAGIVAAMSHPTLGSEMPDVTYDLQWPMLREQYLSNSERFFYFDFPSGVEPEIDGIRGKYYSYTDSQGANYLAIEMETGWHILWDTTDPTAEELRGSLGWAIRGSDGAQFGQPV